MMKPYARTRDGLPAPLDAMPRGDAMDTADGLQRVGDAKQISVIGADITITGDIEASVDLHIEGRVKGDVRCATLILGENSMVTGSIYADRVRVSGAVDGAIETRDLAIEATARVTGNVLYSRLRVANGGVVEGSMKYRAIEEDTNPLKLVETNSQPEIETVFID